MKWFRRKADEDPRDIRIRELECENEALDILVTSAAKIRDKHHKEHERQQRRIDALVQFKHSLEERLEERHAFIANQNEQISDLVEALEDARSSAARAMAEVKRLDGKLVQVDCENLRLNGQLATAEERIAGYEVKA